MRRKNDKGQVSLMVAIMMMTFLFFFCFVVNVGMLVNAKIQLQNAADLAAYAGAATQARLLNRISFLNYEMRRNYKKFLFRYYVMGNRAQKNFPKTATGTKPQTPNYWAPNPGEPGAPNFNVPAVCLIFQSNDNYCQTNVNPKIQIPPPSSFDMINDALRNQLVQLENLRQKNCGKIAATNLYALVLWLYNGDPDINPDFGLASDPDLAKTQQLVEMLVKGLGLVPRELLLRQRIETLKGYLNEPASNKSGVTKDTVESYLKSGDPNRYERTIQAFNSAFYTLGEHTFSRDGIAMDELQSDKQIELHNNSVRFDTWAIYFDDAPPPPPGTDASKIGSDCVPHLVPQTMMSDAIVGVAKDPSILTYYAVRLKAKAKLLFNPWGADGLELKAYAAAQPFGSRIGPNINSDGWVRKALPPNTLISSLINITNQVMVGQVPNLPISEDDSLENGWNTREVLGLLESTGFPPKGGGVNTIDETDLAKAYQLAMAPNPYEQKLYNIPNDLADYDPNSRFSPGMFDGTRAALLWAPLAPPDSPGDLDAQLKSAINDLFHEVNPKTTQMKDALKAQLSNYVAGLKGKDPQVCGAEKLARGLDDSDCESFNMVRITNPLRPRQAAGGNSSELLKLPAWFMPQEAKDVLTSWNSPNDPPPKSDAGRLGYSVKFISFDSLKNGKVQPDSKAGTQLANPPGAGDDEANIDMSSIQH
jgi:Flp pilus assembly protein TadG